MGSDLKFLPTVNKRSNFLVSLPKLGVVGFFFFLLLVILMCIEWYFTKDFTCIILVNNDVGHFTWPNLYFLAWNICSSLLIIFNRMFVLFILLLICRFLKCILDMGPFSYACIANSFLNLWLAYSFSYLCPLTEVFCYCCCFNFDKFQFIYF